MIPNRPLTSLILISGLFVCLSGCSGDTDSNPPSLVVDGSSLPCEADNSCASDPCEDKACGDPCSTCAADDKDCQAQAATNVCDAKGQCVAGSSDTISCDPEPGACEPGQTFDADDGCNTCTCPDSGKRSDAACTKKACPPQNPCEDKSCGDKCTLVMACEAVCNLAGECVCDTGEIDECAAGTCDPGSTFDADDGCNTCTCPDSGQKSEAMCTKKACPYDPCQDKSCGDSCTACAPSDKDCVETGVVKACDVDGQCVADNEELQSACNGTDDTCVPNTTFYAEDGCNTCVCPESGIKSNAYCSDLICGPCIDKACGDACTISNLDCVAACNPEGACQCGYDSKKCTDDPDACTPGTTFGAGDGCNTCTCTDSGKKGDALCTQKPCPSEECATLSCGDNCISDMNCVAYCNVDGKCVCGDDNLGCKEDPDACTPGTTYDADDGCNTCKCPDSGKKSEAACTAKICPTPGCDDKACGDSCVHPQLTCVSACNADGNCVCDTNNLGCEKPIQCMEEPKYFPEFDKTCANDEDCALAVHQVDCCGNKVAWGIAASQMSDFKAAEAVCEKQYPPCKCPQGPTKADDGTQSSNADVFTVSCKDSQCVSSAAPQDCKSSAECPKSQFCDFKGDSCSVWGAVGKCTDKPLGCEPSTGNWKCSCGGVFFMSACESQKFGDDFNKFGGCPLSDSLKKYACGDKVCQTASEYCNIAMNDAVGPGQPEFYANCVPLPDGCGPNKTPDCSCVKTDQFSKCSDDSGFIMMYNMGG